MTKATIVIDIEFDEPADSPTGRAVSASGHERPFHGWLGLASAITELARSGDPAAQTPTATDEGAHR